MTIKNKKAPTDAGTSARAACREGHNMRTSVLYQKPRIKTRG